MVFTRPTGSVVPPCQKGDGDVFMKGVGVVVGVGVGVFAEAGVVDILPDR